MRDPFERLAASAATSSVDPAVVKARARRIRARRTGGLVAASAAAVVLIGVAVVVPRSTTEPEPTRSTELAHGEPQVDALAADGDTSAERGEMPVPEGTAAPVQRDGGALSGRGGPGSAASGSAPVTQDSMGALEIKLHVERDATGRRFTFVVEACNPGDGELVMSYPSGQRFDVEVRRESEAVWRWSDGRAFPQVVGEERWGPGECRGGEGAWSAAWDGSRKDGAPAAPGSYVALGWLTSQGQPTSQERQVCVVACGD